MRRWTLAARMSLLAAAVAVITALIAGGIAASLIRQANTAASQQTLSRLADVVQMADQGPNAQAGQVRNRRTLTALKIASASIDGAGQVTSESKYARDALTPAEIREVLDGRSISSERVVDRQRLLVEARGTRTGGLVLVQRRADAIALGDTAIRRLGVALAIAVGLAVVLGLVVAVRLARPLRRTAAAAHALAAGHRDVTVEPEGPAEVAEVADALNSLASGLATSEGRQREFLMSVSHDLRTPLTSIRGYAESLADGVVAPGQSARVGQILLAEANRLERLVADLLDLARLGAQDFRVDLVPVDVAQLVRATAEVWAARCTAEGLRFTLEVRSEPLPAITDALRLRQVLDGLFENALRVTPAGAPILLAARIDNGSVLVEVRDGGPGLTDADLTVAFERSALYDRYRGVRQVGTGLGLTVVHGLVTRLGARIEAGHALEGGARFTVRLPAAPGGW
ncbi:MAG: HAMP domain-containing sensor histidine kinase [Actinomycetota bacterium]